jgi:predicted enzyme related to lactoylglutathione lyase
VKLKTPNSTTFGKFIWHDLAAADTAAALDFYSAVFGWTAITEYANGGQFIRLQNDGQDVGSMYSMSHREREHGVPSHWTPYICVKDIDAATRKVETAGGTIVVRPFKVEGIARIALVTDSIGSIIGLWETLSYE